MSALCLLNGAVLLSIDLSRVIRVCIIQNLLILVYLRYVVCIYGIYGAYMLHMWYVQCSSCVDGLEIYQAGMFINKST